MKNNVQSPANFFVYVLYSQEYDKYYIGHTQKLAQRLIQHNALSNKTYTSRYRPWSLLCQFTFERH
ncbi:MAG: GIY-YIG nuclease family protein [Saprospiraceae bacterium]|nr:GIY-YIG nuclease family protein [Saprospiraceae bacterium]